MSGTLALIGGSNFGDDDGHHRQLFDPGATVGLLPTAMAYENPTGAIERARGHFATMDNPIEVIPAMNRSDAAEGDVLSAARSADSIYVTGGSPMHLRSVLKDTPLLDALIERWSAGATVAVAAESCSVLCGHMVDNRGGAFTVGLGLVTTLTVIPRFDQWSPDKRTRTTKLAPPELLVVGIDEATALVRSPDGTW
ncbi:MAG: Type 1 glutamine amidotransferase-like domain-containing protein, partial [Microthrixaceae bacterium]